MTVAIKSGSSTATQGWDSGPPTISFPAAAAAGDMCVIGCQNTVTIGNYSATGWTVWGNAGTGASNSATGNILVKELTAGDVSTGSVTLSGPTAPGSAVVVLLDNANVAQTISLSNTATHSEDPATATPSIPASTLTGAVSSNAALVLMWYQGGSLPTVVDADLAEIDGIAHTSSTPDAITHLSIDYSLGAATNPQYDFTAGNNGWDFLLLEVGALNISNVSTDDVVSATENPWTIAGSGFGTQ